MIIIMIIIIITYIYIQLYRIHLVGATKEISTIPLVQEVFWAPAASVSQDELRMPLLDELLDLLDPSGREWNEKISSM
jgi:hypothetical protein